MRDLFRHMFSAMVGACLALLLFAGLAVLVAQVGDAMAPTRPAAKGPGQGSAAQRRMVAFVERPPTTRKIHNVSPKPREKKPKPVEELNRQIVETARPTVEEVPDKANYLGRYDMKVVREQKSKGHKRQGRDLGMVQVDRRSEIQSPESTSTAPTAIPRSGRPKRGDQQEAQAVKAVEKAAPLRIGPGEIEQGGGAGSPEDQPSVVRGRHSDLLLPATSPGNILHNIQALSGNPGSMDWLPDVEDEGETNLLNTRKYRYWDFFQRVKERVGSEWNPARIWQRRDPSGKRYGVRDRLTILRVTLDPDGALKQVRVARRSGLAFLDEEARRAFAAAGPYPNPPAGLVNDHGEIDFQFGFMFEISSSRFRFFRMAQ